MTLKYRAEVDGLRALAVVPVMLFHAGFSLFSGGFVGVDIFFVISGYLITTILIDELEKDKFSIVNFYERRARRILPALSLIMMLCIPLAWMTMPPDNHKEFLNSLVAVSLFCSNILFWLESGYFEAASEEKPLLHTWSLAVEEQYYLLFPIFLFLFWRFGKRNVFILIILMTVCSLALAEWGWRHNSSMNFFLAPFRAWEMFAGSLVAFLITRFGVLKNNLCSLLGLILVLYATFFYDKFIPFPSLYAVLPVLGTSLIILCAGKGTWVNALLSMKVFVGIGLISYSAYLWHQPIFAFSRIISAEPFSGVEMLLLSLISLVLAYLSWRFVEGPFRRKDKIGRKGIFIFSGIVMAIFIGYGSIASKYNQQMESGQFNPFEGFTLTSASMPNTDLRSDSWTLIRQIPYSDLWFDLQDSRTKVLIIGNSHTKDLYNALSESNYGNTAFQFAGYMSQISEIEPNFSDIKTLPNFINADTIMLASRYQEADIEALPNVINLLQNAGKQVVVIKNIHEFPEYRTRKWTLAQYLAYKKRQQEPGISNLDLASAINKAYYDAYVENQHAERVDFSGGVLQVNESIQSLTELYPEIIVLDRMDYICDTESQYCDAVGPDLEKYFYDYGHNTLAGAKKFAENIDRVQWLSPLGEQQ